MPPPERPCLSTTGSPQLVTTIVRGKPSQCWPIPETLVSMLPKPKPRLACINPVFQNRCRSITELPLNPYRSFEQDQVEGKPNTHPSPFQFLLRGWPGLLSQRVAQHLIVAFKETLSVLEEEKSRGNQPKTQQVKPDRLHWCFSISSMKSRGFLRSSFLS